MRKVTEYRRGMSAGAWLPRWRQSRDLSQFVLVCLVAGLSALSAASPMFGQLEERVVNGDFGSSASLTDWPTVGSFVAVQWFSMGSESFLDSDAALVSFSGGINTPAAIAQCLSVEGDQSFTASTRSYIESGQGVGLANPDLAGYFNLYLQFYETPDCSLGTSGVIHQQGATADFPAVEDEWRGVEIDDDVPSTAQSVRMNLRIYKSDGDVGDTFSIFVDDASFITGERIFADGFESGDLGAWVVAR